MDRSFQTAIRLSPRIGRKLLRTPSQLRLLASLATCLLLLLTTSLGAQVATGDILGTVVDPTGAVVAGATVQVENSGTHDIFFYYTY